MSSIHNDRYDEIKNLLKRSRFLLEQNDDRRVNVAQDIQSKINQDNTENETAQSKNPEEETTPKDDKIQKYRVSGGIIALHGKDKKDLDLTSDEKLAFQETMDEFIEEVSDLVDFDVLNIYQNNVDWSGRIIDEDIEFTFTIGEDSGIYINGQMIKVDSSYLELINKLQQYYQKFKSKWSKILASRKKTRETNA